jgi:polysaccharide biosynthesis PFTS motif protein
MHRIYRSRLRQMMRGYRILKKAGRLDCIATIKKDLTTHKLSINKKFYSRQFFGAGIESAELIVRQYLLLRIGGTNLNRALLLAAGKANTSVAFSMPSEWADTIEQYGFKVNRLISALMWRLYVLMMFLNGVLKITKIIFSSLNFSEKYQIRIKPYIYFSELTANNLPKQVQWEIEHNIVSWYLQWDGRKTNVKTICHSAPNTFSKNLGDVELVTQRGPIPRLINANELSKYIGWALFSISLAFIDLFRNRWWHALLLNQSALSAQVRFAPSDLLAKEYLFHNSSWIYRPLWTYDAEQFGATITFYFYSTNCEPFKQASRYPEITYGWRAMSWPRYLVWDEYQANFVRRCIVDQKEVNVVGSIWFGSDLTQLTNIPSKAVAVFDVQPVRDSFYNLLALDFDYYTPRVANKFLMDIQEVLSDSSCAMALKRKREVGMLAHPKYRFCINALEKKENFLTIDPNIDALSLIENCNLVISMPFTSTALLGKSAGKPSIYYDPLGFLQLNDRAAHGIPIIQGKDMLRTWMNEALEVIDAGH